VADDLGVQYFTTAKSQHEAVGKWRLMVIAAIAYLHVALVVPFAEQTGEKSTVDREIADFRSAEAALSPLLTSAEGFASRVQTSAENLANGLRDDLVSGFSSLGLLVEGLRSLGADEAAGDAGAAFVEGDPGQPPQIQMQMQMPVDDVSNLPMQQSLNLPVQQQLQDLQRQEPPIQQQIQVPMEQSPMQGQLLPPPVFLSPMASELRRQVADNSAFPGPGEVSAEFADYIDAAIIAPAFQKANDAWRAWNLPDLKTQAESLTREIEGAKAAAQSATAELDSLAAAVAALGEAAEKLAFAPPSDPRWWVTVAGKESSIRTMMEGFTQEVANVGERQVALRTLEAKVSAIVGQKTATLDRINAALAALDKQATDLQSQLGELGGPLKAVSFKLELLAPLLPLIVGVALAGFAIWGAEGLRRMTLAARLASDEPGRVIRGWLKAAAGGSTFRLALQEVFFAALSVGWIILAARAVESLAVPFLRPPAILATAIGTVVAARLYHWYLAAAAIAVGRA
jgi:hypothetical protein